MTQQPRPQPPIAGGKPALSVIIPAHNEQAVLPRLLAQLLPAGPDPTMEIIVAVNGSTDDTFQIAAAKPGVIALQTPVAGKPAAMRLADAHTEVFPRIYVDADVDIRAADLALLAQALRRPGVLAAAPTRVVDLAGSTWPVRAYYTVWCDLPNVRSGIFGRGVIGVSRAGHARLVGLPTFMADDLAASAVLATEERVVVEGATVVVHAPRNWQSLMARRVRVVTGTHEFYSNADQFAGAGHTGATQEQAPQEGSNQGSYEGMSPIDSRTGMGDLLSAIRIRPSNALRMPVFVAGALISRRRAARAIRAGDFSTWLRDDSSRGPG